MKAAYKLRIATSIVPVFAVAIIVAPQPAFAVEATGACAALPVAQAKYQTASATRLATMNSDFTKRIANISDRDSTIDSKIQASRQAAAEKFAQGIAKLTAQQGLTAEQQTAITTYQSQLQTAEKERESAVDAARATYRQSLQAVVQQHQTTLSAAAETFQSSVATAFTTAIANCSNSTARAALKTSIVSAKATFTAQRESAKVTDQIKALVQARDTAIKTADTAFSDKAKEHAATLTAALGTLAAS